MTAQNNQQTGIYFPALNQIGFVTNGAERFRILETGQLQAVYESTVGTDYNTTLHNGYLCRAWVSFDGTGTVTIRASGNVSSITDRGVGLYTANLSVAMPDNNMSIQVTTSRQASENDVRNGGVDLNGISLTSSTIPIVVGASFPEDRQFIFVAVFR
jgi:hypothetical protein